MMMMIKQIFFKTEMPILCLLTLLLCHIANGNINNVGPSEGVCMAEKDSPSCNIQDVYIEKERNLNPSRYTKPDDTQEHDDGVESDSLLHRGMQGLEAVLDKMASSSDQMMHDMIDSMSESRAKMMAGLDSMMDRMSESRTKMMKGLDAMMERVTKTKEEMKKGFDDVIDQVSHSKMMEEIDLLLESIKKSKVMMEIRALPEEIRQSFILSARNRSYIYAGVLVAITAAVLFSGAIYYAWCHHDAWSYYIGTIDEAKALLKQYKESGILSRSRTSSEDGSKNESVKENGSVDKKGSIEMCCKDTEDQKNLLSKDESGTDLLKQVKNEGVEVGFSDDVFEDDDDVFETLTPIKALQNGKSLQGKDVRTVAGQREISEPQDDITQKMG